MAETVKKRHKAASEIRLRRIQAVWNWIAQGYTNAQIRDSIVKEWGISERQAYNYTKTAYAYAKKEVSKDVEASYAFHIETRKESLRTLKTQKEELLRLRKAGTLSFKEATQLILSIEDQILKTLCDIAKIEGVYAPSKTDITSGGKSIQVYTLPDGTQIEF